MPKLVCWECHSPNPDLVEMSDGRLVCRHRPACEARQMLAHGAEVADVAAHAQQKPDRLVEAFRMLTGDERHLLVCALAGNHPPRLAGHRMPVLRALAKAESAWGPLRTEGIDG